MKMKRIISLAIALLLVCGMPVSAFADDWYLENGDITVNATESGQTVTQGTQVDVPDSAPVITQSNSSTPTTNTVTINADENATANVMIQDVNIVISDPQTYPQDHNGEAAVTINVADGAAANVTLKDVYIDVSETGGLDERKPATLIGEAAVQIMGNGDVTLELDGENTVQSGFLRAGVEKNTTDDTGNGNLTITDETGTSGSLNVTGGEDSAGIGGHINQNSSNITISGSAKVTATGGRFGSGIGGGYGRTGINITVAQDAQVKAQGGTGTPIYGAGAAIGEGGKYRENGGEVAPNTDELTPNGKIEYYAPGANMENENPIKTVTGTYVPPQDEEKPDQPSQPSGESAAEETCSAPLYRVINQDGKDIPHQAERKDGVLTVTVDAEFASLTGSLGGINALKEQGIDTIVFVTNGAASTFALSDLLAQGTTGDSYTLNHNGAAVSFTLDNGADLGRILQ